ncbi:uncharacterized protein [Anabrus simplex]|uniref:uncharacterized protein isoform X2 n=1 Tax=Anabrus simplex TaxID=316456 RepID=UPI0035A28E73
MCSKLGETKPDDLKRTTAGGYKFEITKMEACDSSSVFQVQPGFKVDLVEDDGKCMAVPNGCITVKQQCDSATMTYDLMRGIAPIKGTRDCCSDMENMSSETKAILAMFGLPDQCPVEAGTVCSKDGKGVDVTAYTSYFSMLTGPTTGTIKFDHGNAKSCIKVGCKMTKPFRIG